MAKTIELECPGCAENLQLDAGFAGGVCRCFSCGTLMTVPADARRERAEKLVRPVRPGEAPRQRPKRPGRPGAPGQRPAAPPPSPVPPDERDDRSPREERDGETEVYVTESGRSVEVNTRRGIPTATKRRVARVTTYVVFSLFIAVLLGMCGVAVYVLLNPPPPESPLRALPVETFTYDPAANPLTLDKPNALGLPLRERTAIVIDASASSEPWLGDVSDAVARGLSRVGGSRVEVVYATSAGPMSLFNDTEPLTSVTPVNLAALRGRVSAAGEASISDAVAAAMAGDPTHVIVITSERLSETDAARVRESIASRPDLIVDAVVIDRESLSLEGLAESRMGRYVRLSTSQFSQWKSDATPP